MSVDEVEIARRQSMADENYSDHFMHEDHRDEEEYMDRNMDKFSDGELVAKSHPMEDGNKNMLENTEENASSQIDTSLLFDEINNANDGKVEFDMIDGPENYEENDEENFGEEDDGIDALGMLSAVNDFQNEEMNEGEYLEEDKDCAKDHQTEGENGSTSHKWHPHTVKVLGYLRKNISLTHDKETSYGKMTRNTKSRRTAVACFFELLQLKTLNFVQLEQDIPFGDILVTPAARFHDHVPALATKRLSTFSTVSAAATAQEAAY